MSDTDAGGVVHAADRAFALVEAVDEPWLYRLSAQAMLGAGDTTDQTVMCRPDAEPELLIRDRTQPAAWIQGEFQAVSR